MKDLYRQDFNEKFFANEQPVYQNRKPEYLLHYSE